ncbi:MAG: hypothetical protein IT265_08285 [Saprospiraceae bacterium]|nr:hypothetical protein [Saprospiraceae bacterium]
MKVNWNFISFILAVLAIVQVYIIVKDYRESNKELANFINVFDDKLAHDNMNNFERIRINIYDTSNVNSLLERFKDISMLDNIYYEYNRNNNSNKPTYSLYEYFKLLPKSLCLNYMNINQLNLLSKKIELNLKLNNYFKEHLNSKNSSQEINLIKYSKHEYFPLPELKDTNLYQFIINSDTLPESSLPYILYENKFLNRKKIEVKCLFRIPKNNHLDTLSHIFYLSL